MTDRIGEYDAWLKFIHTHRCIYLYGAGKYAKYTYKMMLKHQITPKRVVTTSGQQTDFFGQKIAPANAIIPKINSEDGIVVALNINLLPDVKKMLHNIPSKQIFVITKVLYSFFYRNIFLNLLEDISPKQRLNLIGKKEIRKILVIRLDLIGDMIWTTPFLRELRRNYPNATVSLIVRPSLLSLLDMCPYIDSLFVYDEKKYLDLESMAKRAQSYVEFKLNNEIYDLVITPRFIEIDDNFFLSMWTRCYARYGRYCETNKEAESIYLCVKKYYTGISIDNPRDHVVMRILNILHIMGCLIQSDQQELWIEREEKIIADKYDDIWGSNSVKIAVAMFSFERMKEWSIEYYQMLYKRFYDKYKKEVLFILLGIESEKFQIKDSILPNCVNLLGHTSLSEAAAIVSKCDLYLGADTSIMHMAATFKKPVVEISPVFRCDGDNPYSPSRAGAWKTESIVLHPRHGLNLDEKDCCNAKISHCINQVSVDEVEHAIEKLSYRKLK